jgi:SAM-dependent methyltransferase
MVELWLIVVLGIGFVLFAFVIAYGAPYLPTLKKQTIDAVDLMDLRPGQVMVELGCGDGRVQLEAARRGIKSVGYELNPLLVLLAKIRTLRYRSLVSVHLADYWRVRLPPETDAVYVFLLKPFMAKLDKKITHEISKKVKLVSYAFEIPNRKPTEVSNGMFVYEYEPQPKKGPGGSQPKG